MSLRKMLKFNAKQSLRGSWGTAIGVIAVPMGVSLLLATLLSTLTGGVLYVSNPTGNPILMEKFSDAEYFAQLNVTQLLIFLGLSLLSYLIMLFIESPLSYGSTRWYYNQIQGKQPGFRSLFDFYSTKTKFLKSVRLAVSLALRAAGWALLIVFPASIIYTILSVFSVNLGNTNSNMAFMGPVLAFVGVIIFALACFFCVVFLGRYFLAPYYIFEDESLTVKDAVKLSIKHTEGNLFDIVWFGLSFWGWMILSIMVLPVAFYSVPYIQASTAMYAKYLIETGKRNDALINQQNEYANNPV